MPPGFPIPSQPLFRPLPLDAGDLDEVALDALGHPDSLVFEAPRATTFAALVHLLEWSARHPEVRIALLVPLLPDASSLRDGERPLDRARRIRAERLKSQLSRHIESF